jgi:hypothetical protein
MSKDKPTKEPKTAKPDDLTKAGKDGKIELTEEELGRASGGCGTGMSKAVV